MGLSEYLSPPRSKLNHTRPSEAQAPPTNFWQTLTSKRKEMEDRGRLQINPLLCFSAPSHPFLLPHGLFSDTVIPLASLETSILHGRPSSRSTGHLGSCQFGFLSFMPTLLPCSSHPGYPDILPSNTKFSLHMFLKICSCFLDKPI